MDTMIGVIGGSGLYEIDGLEGADWVTIETPWGDPSDQIMTTSDLFLSVLGNFNCT